MKYKSLKADEQRILHIPVPKSGMDLSKTISSQNKNCLELCSNAELKNGRITTRAGLMSYVDNVLDMSELKGAWDYEYVVTDTVYYMDDVPFNIAYVNVKLDADSQYCRVFLIGDGGLATTLGDIGFTRTDATTYFVPSSISFYTGKPQKGAGIFALVALNNIYASDQTQSIIYEINESLEEWMVATSYYIPTVYINGKGNRYEFAKQTGQAYEAAPKNLEKLNILNGKFYAYYSSDGYSSSFKLPFTDISNSSVVCRIYTAADEYTEWRVEANKTKVAQSFCSVSVTMNLSREKGIVYFTVEAGDFEVPLMSQYRANNIRILAQTSTNDDFYSVATSKCMAYSGGDIYFAGGEKKNRIYYTSYENPLYFPQIYDNTVGSADIEVTALASEKDKLIAFKPLSVYSIKTKKGKAINDNSILHDNGKIFYDTNSFEISEISKQCGNIHNNTVAFVGSRCVWFDGKHIYCMPIGGTQIYDITEKISPIIETLGYKEKKNAFGFAKDNNYFLLLSGKAVIIDFDKSGISANENGIGIYMWQLPSGISFLGASKNYELTFFLCLNEADGICYTAYPEGDSDIIIKKVNGVMSEIPYDIETQIKFAGISFGNMSRKRRIKGISFKISAQADSSIKLQSDTVEKEFALLKSALSGENENTVRFITDMYGAETLGLEFKSSKSISLGECDIYYIEY